MPEQREIFLLGCGDSMGKTVIEEPTLEELKALWDKNRTDVNVALAQLTPVPIPISLLQKKDK